jgi:hypothetical protein
MCGTKSEGSDYGSGQLCTGPEQAFLNEKKTR